MASGKSLKLAAIKPRPAQLRRMTMRHSQRPMVRALTVSDYTTRPSGCPTGPSSLCSTDPTRVRRPGDWTSQRNTIEVLSRRIERIAPRAGRTPGTPLEDVDRVHHYWGQNGARYLTPAQRRRVVHKAGRDLARQLGSAA